jgi:metal-sulfur cluster biosynthetic enzyme
MIDRDSVWRALEGVRDPELDEPITGLGFVAAVSVSGGRDVAVRLRLPTYFCAPNFTWMMAADAEERLGSLPGVGSVRVTVDDHFVSGELEDGLARGEGFAAAFPRHADGELGELRSLFARKALLARQWEVVSGLGRSPEELAALTLGSLMEGDSAAVAAYLERRAELGISCAPSSPLLVTASGAPVDADRAELHLRFARATHVSIEGNADLCRGLLETRYGTREEVIPA